MTNEIFDKHAENYSEDIDETLGRYGANHDFFTRHKAWLIADILHRFGKDPKDLKLLDVGCGVGKIHEYLKDDFSQICGIDTSQTSIEVAKRTYPSLDYRSYDGTSLPYPNETFDVSIAICVFHHVPPPEWETLASEMLRVLRRGGTSLVIEHNPYNPVTRRIVNTCELDRDAVLLSPSKLKGLFRKANARNVESRAILSVPPKNALLKRIDHALGILPLGAQYYTVAEAG